MYDLSASSSARANYQAESNSLFSSHQTLRYKFTPPCVQLAQYAHAHCHSPAHRVSCVIFLNEVTIIMRGALISLNKLYMLLVFQGS